MAKAPHLTLTPKQLKAAGILSSGASRYDAAEAAGVTVRTLVRWFKLAAFKAEIDRLKQQSISAHQRKLDELQQAGISTFYEELRRYRQKRLDFYKVEIELGQHILSRVQARLLDLPDEAIALSTIPQLIKAADELTENGLQGMAELIGIDAVMEKLNEPEQG